MEKEKFKVLLYLKKSRLDRSGKTPIMGRITLGRSMAQFSCKISCDQKWNKILQYGERVFGITNGTEEQRIEATIIATEEFFRSLGLKTKLSENGVGEEVITELVKRMKDRDNKLGEKGNVTYVEVAKILELSK